MNVVVFVLIFGVFFLGLVLAIQGFVGRDPPEDGQLLFIRKEEFSGPGVQHPPEAHRLRLFLIGLGLMATAVLIGAILA